MTKFYEVEGELFSTIEDAKAFASKFTTGYCREWESEYSFEEVCESYEAYRNDGESINDSLSMFAKKGKLSWN